MSYLPITSTIIGRFSLLCVFLVVSSSIHAASQEHVDHYDPIEVDKDLSLAEIVQQSAMKYPDQSWLNALEPTGFTLSRSH